MLSREFGRWLGAYADEVPEHERDFLQKYRAKCGEKPARFRSSCKLHKTPDWHIKQQPLRFRPIVTCYGTWVNRWSKWLDQYLQMLTRFISTYINNTDKLLRWLRMIKGLPPWAFLFTTDADSMYTNINTEHAIRVIGEWLDELSTHPDFPPD